jgi:predicted secreted protein
MNTYRDSRVRIEESVGDSFVVSLESLPSGGYSWTANFDEDMLDLTRSRDFTSRSAAIGASGQEEFEFKAKRPGESQISLTYKRPWEKEPRKTELFQVRITGS